MKKCGIYEIINKINGKEYGIDPSTIADVIKNKLMG